MSTIPLSDLAPPDVAENIDMEAIQREKIDSISAAIAEYNSGDIGSDPVVKVTEDGTYREAILRQRINDAARSVMVASARGADLDQIGANLGETRQDGEDDERFRQRIVLAPEKFTTAGSEGAYIARVLESSPVIKDVHLDNPEPACILLTMLSTSGSGEVDTPLLEQVRTVVGGYLPGEDPEQMDAAERARIRAFGKMIRPVSDLVRLQSATAVGYTIEADLVVYQGPDAMVVADTARTQLQQLAASRHTLGSELARTSIEAALHPAGVKSVQLRQPETDLVAAATETLWCSGILINVTQEQSGMQRTLTGTSESGVQG